MPPTSNISCVACHEALRGRRGLSQLPPRPSKLRTCHTDMAQRSKQIRVGRRARGGDRAYPRTMIEYATRGGRLTAQRHWAFNVFTMLIEEFLNGSMSAIAVDFSHRRTGSSWRHQNPLCVNYVTSLPTASAEIAIPANLKTAVRVIVSPVG